MIPETDFVPRRRWTALLSSYKSWSSHTQTLHFLKMPHNKIHLKRKVMMSLIGSRGLIWSCVSAEMQWSAAEQRNTHRNKSSHYFFTFMRNQKSSRGRTFDQKLSLFFNHLFKKYKCANLFLCLTCCMKNKKIFWYINIQKSDDNNNKLYF